MDDQDLRLLERAIELAAEARAGGNHPFGSLLANARGDVLLEARNSVVTERDVTNHAELNLVRLASRTYEPETLAETSLYTSTEPCAMCAGAVYWSGIGRIVYALPEAALYRLTGADPENPTMKLGVQAVVDAGQRHIDVEGPADLTSATAVHEGFWTPDSE